MNKEVKNFISVNSNYLCIFRWGAFWHAFESSSIVLNYLFDYKIKDLDNKECGFPDSSYGNVIEILKQNKINFKTVLKSEEMKIQDEMDFKNENKYSDFLNKGNSKFSRKLRVDRISRYLNEHIEDENFKNKLREIEGIIDD